MNAERLLAHYERIADAPDAIASLRRFILDLAARGKLVPQDPNDEPASELLKRTAAEKARLVKAGKLRERENLPLLEEAELPFFVPTTWGWVRLGELGLTQTGTTPPKSRPDYYGDHIPFIKPGDILPSYVDYANEGLSRTGVEASGRIAVSGSILMVCIGTIGKCQLINRDCSFNQQINSLSLYAETEPSYLLEACQSEYFQQAAWAASARTTISILNKGNWELLPIPLPPLAEQHRIVVKVDELMALCERLEAARAEREATRDRLAAASLARLNAPDPDRAAFQEHARFALNHLPRLTTRSDQIKHLRQTILNLAVRGKLVPQDLSDEPASELLKRIAAEKARLVKAGEIRKRPTLAAVDDAETPFSLPTTWKWVRVGDVFDYDAGTNREPSELVRDRWLLELEDIEKDTSTIFARLRVSDRDSLSTKSEFQVGDILYGKLRPYLNKVVVADEAGYSTTEIVAIRPFLKLRPAYCALAFRRPDFVAYVERLGRGTKMPRLRTPDAIVAIFPLPPLAEQRRIVAKVDELMALCDRLEASLTATDATRRRLLEALLAEALAPDDARELEAAE